MDSRLYNIEQIRSLENAAISQYHIAENTLMWRAGKAAFEFLRQTWANAKKILVMCGPGNNGGDGYVLAKFAKEDGIEVEIRTVGDVNKFTEAAKKAFNLCRENKINIIPFDSSEKMEFDLIVDAVLGIGLKSDVTGIFEAAINSINQAHLPVFSIDVPSGINVDTGAVLNVAVKATATLTFIGMKQGLFTQDAVDHCGVLSLSTLSLPQEIYDSVNPAALQLQPSLIRQYLPPRKRNSHKGNYGHVLVIGGNKGMAGAVRLAGEAALRVGAGLVTVASLPQHASLVLTRFPEIMFQGISQAKELVPLLKKATAIVVGPGFGKDDWSHELLALVLQNDLPTVVDADALNLLGSHPKCKDHWILTPHPAEAARLLGIDAPKIQENRFNAMNRLCELGGTWILKGAGTLIKQESSSVYLCPFGNPGMASGGMGDALSGVIGGLLAQKLNLIDAAKLGVLIHALSGDIAAEKGERGMLASDLIKAIRYCINK